MDEEEQNNNSHGFCPFGKPKQHIVAVNTAGATAGGGAAVATTAAAAAAAAAGGGGGGGGEVVPQLFFAPKPPPAAAPSGFVAALVNISVTKHKTQWFIMLQQQ